MNNYKNIKMDILQWYLHKAAVPAEPQKELHRITTDEDKSLRWQNNYRGKRCGRTLLCTSGAKEG